MSTHRTHYMDSNTRRHPRTLQEAFGPYTSREVIECEEQFWTPVRVALAVVYAVSLITVFCVL